MRIRSILVVVAAAMLAAPLAGQTAPTPPPQPLPGPLTPTVIQRTKVRPAWEDHLELGMFTGILVGMTVGGVYGSLTYDSRCPTLDDCMLAREVDTTIFAIMGGSLGGIIGTGTTFLLNRGKTRETTVSSLDVAPAAGAMRVGVTLRH